MLCLLFLNAFTSHLASQLQFHINIPCVLSYTSPCTRFTVLRLHITLPLYPPKIMEHIAQQYKKDIIREGDGRQRASTSFQHCLSVLPCQYINAHLCFCLHGGWEGSHNAPRDAMAAASPLLTVKCSYRTELRKDLHRTCYTLLFSSHTP